ncbi:helix-turn-helix domain-containing protein [Actinoallomurus vinaceus]|uniref:helix-turn-helix domain-containing protein n=1 Tax=Actinoallomurus vinaceus TaxID=1080074 RepID=UPI003CD06785
MLTGERIRSLRHLLGLSQEQLAAAANIGQSRLSEIENGRLDASNEILERIARATGTPLSFFEIIPPDIPLGTLRFRKYATARRTEEKRIKALYDEAYRITADLLVRAGYDGPDLPMVSGDASSNDIENLAGQAREALQIGGDGPIRHLTRACERAGIAVVPLTLPGEEDEAHAVGHFGVSYWPARHEPAVIGYFTGGPGDRQRFTIGHELGHLVLHSRRRTAEDPENEANLFAGALLLPRDRAVEVFSGSVTLSHLARMKAIWGLSIQALIMRGSHLGFIDEQRKTSLFRQLGARGWKKNEPVPVHPEEPLLVRKMLDSTYGPYVSEPQIADRVGLSAMVLRSFAPTAA